jgi:hypothetical protein
MDGLIRHVVDIYPKGGGVTLDRPGVVDCLQGVHELEEELGRLG